MKAQAKNYFSLTKKEWNGMAVLVILMALVLAAPYVYRYFRKDSIVNIKDFNDAIARLNKANLKKNVNNERQIQAIGAKKFNPNGLADEDWKKLGLDDRQISIIKHYEAKGGHFYKKGDIKKIYGLTAADYERIAPNIALPDGGYAAKNNDIIEINSADSAQLTRIPGIGPAFARRIVYYRERLGGFVYKDQLKEIYGLDEIKYKEISDQVTVNPRRIRQININTVTFDKLRLMPYLTYKQVNAIIEYRTQHGGYRSADDLRQIAIIDDVTLNKIAPYINYR